MADHSYKLVPLGNSLSLLHVTPNNNEFLVCYFYTDVEPRSKLYFGSSGNIQPIGTSNIEIDPDLPNRARISPILDFRKDGIRIGITPYQMIKNITSQIESNYLQSSSEEEHEISWEEALNVQGEYIGQKATFSIVVSQENKSTYNVKFVITRTQTSFNPDLKPKENVVMYKFKVILPVSYTSARIHKLLIRNR